MPVVGPRRVAIVSIWLCCAHPRRSRCVEPGKLVPAVTLAPARRPGTEAADCGNSGAGRLVLRTRNSYKSCRESIAHVRFKRGTRIIGLLVPLIPKFRARVCRECLRNFGIGTLAAVTKV